MNVSAVDVGLSNDIGRAACLGDGTCNSGVFSLADFG